MELRPGDVIDRYEVEAAIGEGGMAKVYRARHTGLGTLHAVKLLSVSSTHVRDRLLQEGRVQASLKHPNIVAVHDIIDVDGAPGLVMEYVDGPTLQALQFHFNHFSVPQLDVLAMGIFAGVEHAHDVKVVHRDLKPANVLLAREGRGLQPKITDFGLAKLLAADPRDSATRSGVAMGTPAFMAPEQVRNSKYVGPAADVWSLGATLFELVTGERAFTGDDVFDIYQRVVEGDRASVAELAPGLPERMARTIDAALVVDVDARAPSVAALRDLWTDGMEASDEDPWDPGELERIGALGQGGKPWSVTDSVERAPSAGSEETLVVADLSTPDAVLHTLPAGVTGDPEPAEAMPSSPSAPALPSAPRTSSLRWPLVAVAVLGLLGTGWALQAMRTPSPSPPEPSPVPAPPAPAAVPEKLPAPQLPAPELPAPELPAPEGPAPVAPAPVRPSPARPAPQPQAAPEPAEPAPVAPAPPRVEEATTSVTVTGHDRVHLENLDTGAIAKPGPIAPGRWRAVAMFAGQPTPTDPFDVAEGQQRTVTCSAMMGACRVD